MPFVSNLPQFFIAVNKIANLARRPTHSRPLEPWDPTRCNKFEQEDISNAFFSLANSQIPEIEKHGGDWKKLADLMKKQTVNSVDITCDCTSGHNPISSSSDAAKKYLQVCLDTSNTSFLANWLVVEVVHLCGGTDLDAWAVKNWLFNVNKSNYPYAYFPILPSEKALMCQGSTSTPSGFTGLNYRAGKFTVWDNVNGNLWPSDRALSIPTIPVPTYGTSLIDAMGPRMIWTWTC